MFTACSEQEENEIIKYKNGGRVKMLEIAISFTTLRKETMGQTQSMLVPL